MEKIKVVIADDEREAREGVFLLIQQAPDMEVAKICKNGLEAIEAIDKYKPDLVLLDIQMPQLNGFEVLKSLSFSPLPVVIFITAYDQYTLKAFEVHAVDYLLKPFTDERFFKALDHARDLIKKKALEKVNKNLNQMLESYKDPTGGQDQLIHEQNPNKKIINNRLVVKSDGKIVFIPLTDIVWVQAFDYYIRIHLANKFHLVRESMKKMEQILPGQFARVHKSSIVNINHINEIGSHAGGEYLLKLSQGEEVKTSRNYRDTLKEKLKI